MTTTLKELVRVRDNSNMKGVFNMKTKINISQVDKKITMTKATAKKASSYGSEEYKLLLKFMNDYPNFDVEIVSPKTKAKAANNKGLTMAVMEKYVREMSNGNTEAIEEFRVIKDFYQKTPSHYSKPKKYFLSQYPNWQEWLPQAEKQQAQAAEIEEVEVEAEVEQEQAEEQAAQIEHKAAAVEEIKKKSLFGKYLNI